MGIAIRLVESQADLKQFIELPYRLYRDDPYWVPPLRSEQWKLLDRSKHPFHQHASVEYFLAYEAGRVVGRIAAIDNYQYTAYWQEQTGFFGFFESENRPDVAHALYDAATDWLRRRDLALVRGPMNFSTNEEVAFLLEGFNSPPVFMMTYNPPYYLALAEAYGFKKAKDLYAYLMTKDARNLDPERFAKLERVAAKAGQRAGISIRAGRLNDLNNEVRRITQIYNQAWGRNWGFVPLTEAELSHMASELKLVIVPDLLLMAEKDGRPIACALSLPDFNEALKHANGNLFPFGLFKILWARRAIKTLRFLAFGVIPEFQRSGVDAMLLTRMYSEALRLGYERAELSWILEDNHLMNNAARWYHNQLYKKYRIYEMSLA